MRMIDADELKIEMMKAFDCENATKYGNKNAEQQAHSYSTLMLYEISNVVEDCIDNAPTVESSISETYGVAYEQGFRHGKEKYESPQGEWEMHRTSVRGRNYTCNNCHKISRNKFCYCPNCGADMRKGGNEDDNN